MTHLTTDGLPCYRPDGHAGGHRHGKGHRDWKKEYQRRKDKRHSELLAVVDTRWQDGALCAEPETYDPDLWFPEDWEADPASMQWIKQVARAKRTCAACPVRIQCLQFAHENRITTGIWGGLMPEEREKLRRSA